MFVFILDTNKQPLNPTHPARARKLLRSGRASVFRKYPFTIILHDREEKNSTRAEYRLKIDPGAQTTGLAILQNKKVVWAGELTHRGFAVRDSLTARRQIRRTRRNRQTRYRAARFNNRHRYKGGLAPSLNSRIQNILTWVRRLIKICPITAISQELVRFDLQKLQNAEILAIEYQQGTLAGYEIREYLLEKFNRQCVYCKAKDTRLEIEHLIPRSKGGSDRISNLALACHLCNQAKGSKTIQEFLTGKQDLLKAVLGQLKRPLADAAAVNTTRWVLFRQLKELHLPVETGTGGQTKYNRTRQGLDKTHWLDAANVGSSTPERLKILVHKPLLIKAEGWGSRQMVNKNKYGFPLTNKQGKQAAKTRSPIQFGFRTGDIVRAIVPIGKHKGVHIGKVTVRKSGAFDVISNAIKRQSIRWKHCKPLHRKDGYSYA
jgi:5-methylcytosine-specific restriction endonuclease McrA